MGSLATLTVLGILVALLVRPMLPAPPTEPQPHVTLARRCIVFTGVLSVLAVVVGSPLFVLPYLVDHALSEGANPQASGAILLIACLVVAAALTVAAVAASRPWRTVSALDRRYWVVPLIAVLTIAATITNANGYGPLALRWGVLIIAGTFAGTAAAHLVVTAVGPLRPEAHRISHPRATILLAAVIAVPWGELGHGIQIGWWDLLTYANRIDGILPLVLVAAGVTALRRFGLLPSRDEVTLGAHRKLAIAAWIIVLSDNYAFGGTADLTATTALAAAAIGAWLLMPRSQVRHALVVLSQSKQEATAAVRRAVETGVARRTLPGLAKTMRDEVAVGKTDFTEAQEKVTALEERACAENLGSAGHRRPDTVTDTERAFGAFISSRPWERARWERATPSSRVLRGLFSGWLAPPCRSTHRKATPNWRSSQQSPRWSCAGWDTACSSATSSPCCAAGLAWVRASRSSRRPSPHPSSAPWQARIRQARNGTRPRSSPSSCSSSP